MVRKSGRARVDSVDKTAVKVGSAERVAASDA